MQINVEGQETPHQFEWTASESASAALVWAVAEVTGADVTDLEPLYRVVDPDALDAIFTGARESSLREDVTVTFQFAGYHVSLSGTGYGYVQE